MGPQSPCWGCQDNYHRKDAFMPAGARGLGLPRRKALFLTPPGLAGERGSRMMRDRSKFRRRLFMEPLEDRRLLAIAGNLTSGLLKFTGDAGANQLSVTNVVGSTYVFSSTTDIIHIDDNDMTTVVLNNDTAAVTVTAPAGSVNNMSIDLAGGSDGVTLAGLTGTASSSL